MTWFRLLTGLLFFSTLTACEQDQSGAEFSGVLQSDYERHKANREAYMYQGI